VAARPITFLSDYGYADEFAGVCRAVIARIEPGAQVIDISHGVPRHAVRQGAVLLANAVPFTPAGVHLAIVDPGVGSERRPVAVRAAQEDRILVGPDNGVLSLAIDRLGGATEAVDLTASPFCAETVTHTFHGRDIFAPVAARLAGKAKLRDAGESVDPRALTRLELPVPRVYPDRVVAHVIYIDGFGNATLNLDPGQAAEGFLELGGQLRIEAGTSRLGARFAQTFADVGSGEALVYEDSSGAMALAVNRGSAAERLGLAPDDEVVLLPVD
jgi:S-adenosyl-L-methionine hydrolase (adenosine-forming)